MFDIYLDVLHEDCHFSTARRHKGFVAIGEVDSNAVSKDVYGVADHHVVELH